MVYFWVCDNAVYCILVAVVPALIREKIWDQRLESREKGHKEGPGNIPRVVTQKVTLPVARK